MQWWAAGAVLVLACWWSVRDVARSGADGRAGLLVLMAVTIPTLVGLAVAALMATRPTAAVICIAAAVAIAVGGTSQRRHGRVGRVVTLPSTAPHGAQISEPDRRSRAA